MRPNGSDSWLLIYTVAGSGRIGQRTTQPGDWVLFRPRVPQDYGTAGQQWELMWCHFHPRPHWLDWLNWVEESAGVMIEPLNPDPGLIEIFEACRAWTVSGDAHSDALAMNRLEELLLRIDQRRGASRQGIDPRIQATTTAIATDLSAPLTIPILAAKVGLSPSRFSHLFREELGLSPGEFIERLRMDRAAALLRLTEQSIQEVASQVGFENPFYFSLRFKKRSGMSPSSYREQRSELER